MNEFNKEVNHIELSANSNLNNTTIDSMETYPYGTSKDLVYKIKFNSMIK